MNQGRIIVITGSPGTGKTTTASIVAKESDMDKSVHMPVSYTHLDVYKRQADGDAVPAAGGAQYSAVPDVPRLWLGGFAILHCADCADALCAGDLLCLHAHPVYAQHPARAG